MWMTYLPRGYCILELSLVCLVLTNVMGVLLVICFLNPFVMRIQALMERKRMYFMSTKSYIYGHTLWRWNCIQSWGTINNWWNGLSSYFCSVFLASYFMESFKKTKHVLNKRTLTNHLGSSFPKFGKEKKEQSRICWQIYASKPTLWWTWYVFMPQSCDNQNIKLVMGDSKNIIFHTKFCGKHV